MFLISRSFGVHFKKLAMIAFVQVLYLSYYLTNKNLFLLSNNNHQIVVKAGFHMIADDRESQIVDRRKFCDRLRSYGNPLLRSYAIVCDPAIVIADDRRR